MTKTTIRNAFIAGVALLGTGCVTKGLAPDELPVLAADEGLIGVQIDSLDKISQIQFTPTAEGTTLYISGVNPGISTHVFKAKVGEYCVYQIHFGEWRITWDERNLCFTVTPGELSYGGRFAPRVVRGRTTMQQIAGDVPHFSNAVKKQYPAIAGKYLPQ